MSVDSQFDALFLKACEINRSHTFKVENHRLAGEYTCDELYQLLTDLHDTESPCVVDDLEMLYAGLVGG